MNFDNIIVICMALFAGLGAIDKIIGNRFGLGKKFEEGLSIIAELSIAMVGIITISPVLGNLLKPIIVPLFEALDVDPAMFAGCFFANDGGAVTVATSLTSDIRTADFSGLIVGAMMGVTIVYTIPVVMEMTETEDKEYVAQGLVAGLITIPIGCFVGGVVARYPINMIIKNISPIIFLALVVVLGLWKFPENVIRGLSGVGKIVMGIIITGLGAGIIEALTGVVIIPGMLSVTEGFSVVAEIAMILSGAYPFMYVLTLILKKPIKKIGKRIGVNETSMLGFLATMVNSIPTFTMIKEMDVRGKVLNVAFAVSAGFVFGDHLGFTAGYKAELIIPMILGKLSGGVTAVLVAMWITRKNKVGMNCINKLNEK